MIAGLNMARYRLTRTVPFAQFDAQLVHRYRQSVSKYHSDMSGRRFLTAKKIVQKILLSATNVAFEGKANIDQDERRSHPGIILRNNT